ncbi:uncharacterized protein BDZ99DRAFT_527018 [Mytilinidion resinicola]|uniref:Rhodopsin domain-containing protein n=1 Tax=Mytilinidion resinicola TaxID=574789 RepID=A0A6A6Y316_9PEZI|nr:uncharacterized protein BDZ99DRAFT_527018 [Mytilinidion resinicola]KAF2802918.1 hypothetical protein BDZ99DRAFT_527018 [Mytilinidion resinicola]
MSISLELADMVAILKDTWPSRSRTTRPYSSSNSRFSSSIYDLKLLCRVCQWTIYFLTVYTVTCIIVLAQCRPIRKSWDITGQVKGTCINRTIFFYITAGLNVATDIWVTILPIRSLLHIQRPKREKAGLVLIFSMGAFSCVAATIRLRSIGLFIPRTLSSTPSPGTSAAAVLWFTVGADAAE